MPNTPRRLALVLPALLLAASLLAAQQPSRNVRLGLPSPAKADPAAREDYLIERPQYVLSYNAGIRSRVEGDKRTGRYRAGKIPPSPDYSYLPNLLPQLARIGGIGSLGKLQVGHE
jgi:hypothetical protein